jgi:hypothetical protein
MSAGETSSNVSIPIVSSTAAPSMAARGPQENTYASITSDFKQKLNTTSTISQDVKEILGGAAPISGLSVNGMKRPTGLNGYARSGKGTTNSKRDLVVMNALPKVDGATSYNIVNDHFDRQFNVAICGATGNVGRQMLTVLEEQKFPIANLKLLASERSVG